MAASSDFQQMSVKKSNQFVSSYSQKTVTESILVLAAIGRIQEKEVLNDDPELVAELYPSELKQIVSDKNHIYRELKSATSSLMKNSAIMIFDDKKKEFHAIHMIRKADYENSIFKVTFESELKPHILALEKNYTTLQLSIMSSFRSIGSFRLYEVFSAERGLELSARSKKGIKNDSGEVVREYNISQLKFMLGYADATDRKCAELIKNATSDADWDTAYDMLDKKSKKYKVYNDFIKNVIEVAKEELREKSDIRFEYTPIKIGRSYKRIRFYTYPNVPENPKIIDERADYIQKTFRMNDDQLEIPYDLEEYADLFDVYVGHNGLAAEDIKIFLDECGGDKELVKRSIILADEQENLHNYVGWIRACVKNGGYESIHTLDGSKSRAERVEQIVDMHRNLPENASFQERLWSRKPDDDKYFLFKGYLDEHGIELSDFELAYNVDERLIIYKAIINGENSILERYGLPV